MTFTNKQIQEIQNLKEEGYNKTETAQKLKTTRKTVRKYWNKLPFPPIEKKIGTRDNPGSHYPTIRTTEPERMHPLQFIAPRNRYDDNWHHYSNYHNYPQGEQPLPYNKQPYWKQHETILNEIRQKKLELKILK